jgi:protein phosphatase
VKITIPELSLVVLIGASGSGKSTFARKHFKATEILSSDYCRGLVSDDENSQAATKDAFEVLHFIARKRLAAGKVDRGGRHERATGVAQIAGGDCP